MRALCLVILILIALVAAGVRLNVMPSAASGVYWLTAAPSPLDHGLLVVVQTPESRRLMRELHGWLASWLLPIMKPIAALPGDQVCLLDGTLQIAYGSTHEGYGPVLTDHRGHRLPTWIDQGCRTIPEGSVFLASQAVQSLDSRYFGPVRMADIRHRAVPVLTW
jgi:conjugative transfer signal peptidase TraF